MLNLTGTVTAVEVVLQATIPVVVSALIWIGVALFLIWIIAMAIRQIGRAAGLPTEKIFECARIVMERKLEQVRENKNDKQEPFRLDMLGIKIRAEGLTGRVIFIALLGSIAAAGASINSWIDLDWIMANKTP